jgi:hypothetical protein
MTRDELVEKVAQGMPGDLYEMNVEAAKFAIAVVLEEAAKVAERMLVYANTLAEADETVAAAIRALGKDER